MHSAEPQWCRNVSRVKLVALGFPLGPPQVVPFYPLMGEGFPTKLDYRKTKVPFFAWFVWELRVGKEMRKHEEMQETGDSAVLWGQNLIVGMLPGRARGFSDRL